MMHLHRSSVRHGAGVDQTGGRQVQELEAWCASWQLLGGKHTFMVVRLEAVVLQM
jgi:hypothetical protein